VQQDATTRPHPRVCPWCISTITFAARRCVFCGMSLAEELQVAQAAAPPGPPAQAQPHTPARQRLFVVALCLALALAVCMLAMYGVRVLR
jgi:hypothetical protein